MRAGKQVESDEKTEANHVVIRRGIHRKIVEDTLRKMEKSKEGSSRQSEEEVAMVDSLENGSLLSRMKPLTEGMVLGSEAFVARMFAQYRDIFGASRKVEAKPIARMHVQKRAAPSPEKVGFASLYSLHGKLERVRNVEKSERKKKLSPPRM